MASAPVSWRKAVVSTGSVAAQLPSVAQHDVDRRADQLGQVDLVDQQQVGAGLGRAALARDLLAAGHVDHVDGVVDQLRAERRRQVVAAGLDQQQLEIGKLRAAGLRRR